MISICFVFPYVGQGGVPVLFSQLANYLDTNKLARVSIVDYADGSLFKLTNSSVKKIIYNPFHSTHIKSDFLVFQSMSPWSLYPGLKPSSSSRLFFWTLHPDNFKILSSPFIIKLTKYLPENILRFFTCHLLSYLRQTTNILLSKNSLAFMDLSTLSSSQQRLDTYILDPVLLPICYSSLSKCRLPKSSFPAKVSSISFAWIGRLVSFKTPGLLTFATQLNNFAEYHRIIIPFHVIGSGDSSISHIFSRFNHLQVTSIPDLSLEDLESYLLANVNFAFAMGTSALVTSSLAIPTLLAPIDTSPVDLSVSFDWLHKHTGYVLGQDSSAYAHEHFPLQETLLSALSQYPLFSNEALNYFHHNHSIEATSHMLLSCLQACSFTSRDFPKCSLFANIPISLYSIFRFFSQIPTLFQ